MGHIINRVFFLFVWVKKVALLFEISWWSERSKRTNKIIIIYIILHEHIDVKQIGLVWSNHQNDMILSLFFT